MTSITIPLFKVFMSEDVIKPLTQTVMSGFITQGPIVEEFEKALIDFIGNPAQCLILFNLSSSIAN